MIVNKRKQRSPAQKAHAEKLRPYQFTSDQDRKKAAEAGRKGGAALRERAKVLKNVEYLEKSLSAAVSRKILEEFENERGEKQNYLRSAASVLVREVLKGNMRAFEILKDLLGESRKQIEITQNTTQPVDVRLIAIDPQDKENATKIQEFLSEEKDRE